MSRPDAWAASPIVAEQLQELASAAKELAELQEHYSRAKRRADEWLATYGYNVDTDWCLRAEVAAHDAYSVAEKRLEKIAAWFTIGDERKAA